VQLIDDKVRNAWNFIVLRRSNVWEMCKM
jgi:hypothetical protein